ncbi:MAG: tandem-95 repeat protein [Proteobacteria bacterium]|nr:tandem-95 repeat protein [Pseudomonadota bacterium]
MRRISVLDRNIEMDEDAETTIVLEAAGSGFEDVEFTVEKRPENGLLSGEPPHLVYRPNKNFHGKDAFSYYGIRRNRKSNVARIFIDILPGNDLPIAIGRRVTVLEDTEVKIELTATDIDNDRLSYRIVNGPLHGKLSDKPPFVKYLPYSNYFGEDTFSFVAEDLSGRSEPAGMEIWVQPVNDPPVAVDRRITTYRNLPIRVELFSTDPEGSTVSFERTTDPENGKLKRLSSRFMYYPGRNFVGRDGFSFRSYDGFGYSNSARVDIEVKNIDHDSDLKEILKCFVRNGGVAIGDYSNPDHIYQSGVYVPASILKIATAAASLHLLGEDYRFQTRFYLDQDRNLYIRGYGDPSLTTAQWYDIARTLSDRGLFDEPIKDLILDDTAFESDPDFDGRQRSINYFDAPLGAMASNYNTASVKILSGRTIVSWKDKTPVTPMIVRRTRGMPKGFQHFSIAKTPAESTKYSGELAKAILAMHGAVFEGRTRLAGVPENSKAVLVYRSTLTLKEVVRKMLKDSNNFIANQLLLVMALEKNGEGARLAEGVSLLNSFLNNQLGIETRDFKMVEGSGLSKKNRIDLLAMLKLVNYFEKYRNLLPPLSASKYSDLAKSGRRWRILAKSGTLKEVSTLAGFIYLKNNKWKPFVIMLGQDWKNRGRILEIIGRYYNG